MRLRSVFIQIIRIAYVLQLIGIIYIFLSYWGWTIKSNFSDLMSWLAVEISLGVPIMFDWLFREDYAKKIFDSNIERYENEKLEQKKTKQLKHSEELTEELNSILSSKIDFSSNKNDLKIYVKPDYNDLSKYLKAHLEDNAYKKINDLREKRDSCIKKLYLYS